MQLQDQGRLNITDLISLHADPILARLNKTSVQQLFGGDFRAAYLTIADFLNMVSGSRRHFTRSRSPLTHSRLDFSPPASVASTSTIAAWHSTASPTPSAA